MSETIAITDTMGSMLIAITDTMGSTTVAITDEQLVDTAAFVDADGDYFSDADGSQLITD